MKSSNENLNTPASEIMKDAKRWILRDENNVLYFLNGLTCQDSADCNTKTELFGTYDEAWREVRGPLVGVAFALGPDLSGRHWQEIIIADVKKHFSGATAWHPAGYVEICCFGEGIHGIGYGRRFAALRGNGSGIEAHAENCFFIFSGGAMRDETLTCLADFVEREVKPYHAQFDGSIGETPQPATPSGLKTSPSL